MTDSSDESQPGYFAVNDSSIQSDFAQISKDHQLHKRPSPRRIEQESSVTSAKSFYDKQLDKDLFNCPLTRAPFVNPVIAADLITYEELAISTWLLQHDVSPMLGTRMKHQNLVKNRSIKQALELLSMRIIK